MQRFEQHHAAPPALRPVAPPPAGRTRPRSSSGDGVRGVLSTIAILLIAPIIAVLLTAFVFQSYQVDGPSMNNTLHNNDRLIVWKLPRTWAKITGHAYTPNRGDIIVFTTDRLSEFGQDPEKQLIKRVIGLPGDRVVVSGGVITIYNAEHPGGFHPDTDLPYHRTGSDTSGEINQKIPQGQLFVLGDNRTNSLDSRSFGAIDISNVIGKLIVRILPLSDFERF